jgi:hypothetical protein
MTMKNIALVIAASILTAVPALAQQPTFKCNITGSASDGWEIKVTNSLPPYNRCTAECTITLNDGNQTTRTCSTGIPAGVTDMFMCGETLANGTPLKNPAVTGSCS